MTHQHPEFIDPDLARRRCTPEELEIILARNYGMTWTMIAQMASRSCGQTKRIWGTANLKVNGGYVPSRRLSKEERAEERARLAADPDIIRGLKGIPTVGLSKPGAGIIPGKPTRSGK